MFINSLGRGIIFFIFFVVAGCSSKSINDEIWEVNAGKAAAIVGPRDSVDTYLHEFPLYVYLLNTSSNLNYSTYEWNKIYAVYSEYGISAKNVMFVWPDGDADSGPDKMLSLEILKRANRCSFTKTRGEDSPIIVISKTNLLRRDCVLGSIFVLSTKEDKNNYNYIIMQLDRVYQAINEHNNHFLTDTAEERMDAKIKDLCVWINTHVKVNVNIGFR